MNTSIQSILSSLVKINTNLVNKTVATTSTLSGLSSIVTNISGKIDSSIPEIASISSDLYDLSGKIENATIAITNSGEINSKIEQLSAAISGKLLSSYNYDADFEELSTSISTQFKDYYTKDEADDMISAAISGKLLSSYNYDADFEELSTAISTQFKDYYTKSEADDIISAAISGKLLSSYSKDDFEELSTAISTRFEDYYTKGEADDIISASISASISSKIKEIKEIRYTTITKNIDTGSYFIGYYADSGTIAESNELISAGIIYLSMNNTIGRLEAFATVEDGGELKLISDDTDVRALVSDVNGNIQSISALNESVSALQVAVESLSDNSDSGSSSSSSNSSVETYVLTGIAPQLVVECENGKFVDIDLRNSLSANVILSATSDSPFMMNVRVLDGESSNYELNNKNLIANSKLSGGVEHVIRVTAYSNNAGDTYFETINEQLLFGTVKLANNVGIITSLMDPTDETIYLSSMNLSSEFGYVDDEYLLAPTSSQLVWNIESATIDISNLMSISGNELIFTNPSGIPSSEFTVYFSAKLSGVDIYDQGFAYTTFNLSGN